MGSSVRLCAVLELWITFWQKIGITTTAPTKKLFSGENCARIHAVFCSAIFLVWYLCRLKPQDIRPNSKITPSIPLRCSRLYPLFHLISPKTPSAWMLLFIRSKAPCTQLRLFRTSLWNCVSSSLMRTTRFSLLL